MRRPMMNRVGGFCAVLLSLMSLVCPVDGIAQDADHDVMSDEYELLFGLDPTNSEDAVLDPDGDEMHSYKEYVRRLDPLSADTDQDGFTDGDDDSPLSRAVFMWGMPRFTFTNNFSYTGPSWLLSAGKVGGAWVTNGSTCWDVGSAIASGTGSLRIGFNRALLTNDLVLRVDCFDRAGSSLYVDLYDSNGVVVVSDVCGNVMNGVSARVSTNLSLPLRAYPQATEVWLRRGQGQVTVYSCMLYRDGDHDGLDTEQENQLETLDNNPDCDADGVSDGDEVFRYRSFPTLSDSDGDTLSDGVEVLTHGTDPVSVDTDGDGMNDDAEVGHGRNPLMVDTYQSLPFYESFETGTVVTGNINGQHGWSAYPPEYAVVQSNRFYDGSRALGIIGGTVTLRQLLVPPSGTNQIWSDFHIQALPAVPGTGVMASAAFCFTTNGGLHVCDGPGGWRTISNVLSVCTGQWVRVTVGLDYGAQVWAIVVNGALVAANLEFGAPASSFSEWAATSATGCVDALRITTEVPSDLSIDYDSLTDAWEIQYFGSNEQTESGDPDGDGLTNLQEFLSGSNPTQKDSDGDGINDGLELQYGASPSISNAYAQLPFTDTFEDRTTTVGALNGQNGWTVTAGGAADVQTNRFVQGKRAVSLGGNGAKVCIQHLFGLDGKGIDEVWLDMHVQGIAAAQPTGELDAVAVFYFRQDGVLMACDGIDQTWQPLNLIAGSNDWVRFDVRLDYSKQSWDLYGNGILLGKDLGFASAGIISFSQIRIEGESGLVDNVGIAASSPFDDTDADGILDVHEKYAESDPYDATSRPSCFFVNCDTGVDVRENTSPCPYVNEATPARTIQAVIDAINAGAVPLDQVSGIPHRVIYLSGSGVYPNTSSLTNRNLRIPRFYNITSRNISSPAVIDGGGQNAFGFVLTNDNADAATAITYLTISNFLKAGVIANCGQGKVQNCTIVGNGRGLEGRLTSLTVEDCVIRSNTGLGLYSGFGDTIVRRSWIVGNGAGVVVHDEGGLSLESSVIASNLCNDSVGGMPNWYPVIAPIWSTGEGSLFLNNCLVFANSGGPVLRVSQMSYANLVNCTVVDNPGGGMMGDPYSSILAWNTILANPSSAEVVLVQPYATAGLHHSLLKSGVPADAQVELIDCLTGDPKLTPDYHIAPFSRCIDSGTDWLNMGNFRMEFNLPVSDLDAQPRPAGRAYDIGAYEWKNNPSFDLVTDEKALYNAYWKDGTPGYSGAPGQTPPLIKTFGGLCSAVASKGRGSFMLCSGDMIAPPNIEWTIANYIAPKYTESGNVRTFVYPWYNAVGNHEMDTWQTADGGRGTGREHLEFVRAMYQDNELPGLLTGSHQFVTVANAANSPHRTTYSFDSGDMRFIIFNQYCDGVSDEAYVGGSPSRTTGEFLSWLEDELKDANALGKQVVVTAHAPAYAQPDDKRLTTRHRNECLVAYPKKRDAFWKLLKDYGVGLFFCGHTHNMSVSTFDGVVQMDVGNGFGTVGDRDVGNSGFGRAGFDGRHLWYETYQTVDRAAGGTEYELVGTGIVSGILLPRGSTWRYTTATPSEGWTLSSYNDSAWSSRAGPISLGTSKAYFRTKFTCKDLSLAKGLRLMCRLDDAAVVYLNGAEVTRRNLDTHVEVDDEVSDYYLNTVIPTTGLIQGENTLAVEVSDGTTRQLVYGISADSDDAEEYRSAGTDPVGTVRIDSSDLELPCDGQVWQQVGLRFTGVTLTPGEDILGACIQFVVDEATPVGYTATRQSRMNIAGHKLADPPTFSASPRNISDRPQTTKIVSWDPQPWLVVGDASSVSRTPDLSQIVEELTGTSSGWVSGRPLVFIFSANGQAQGVTTNVAVSRQQSSTLRPQLLIGLADGVNPDILFDMEVQYWSVKGLTRSCYNDFAIGSPAAPKEQVSSLSPNQQVITGPISLTNYIVYNAASPLSFEGTECGYSTSEREAAYRTTVGMAVSLMGRTYDDFVQVDPGKTTDPVFQGSAAGCIAFLPDDLEAQNAVRWDKDAGESTGGFKLTFYNLDPLKSYRLDVLCHTGAAADNSHTTKALISGYGTAGVNNLSSAGVTKSPSVAGGVVMDTSTIPTGNTTGDLIAYDKIDPGADGQIELSLTSDTIGAANAIRLTWTE